MPTTSVAATSAGASTSVSTSDSTSTSTGGSGGVAPVRDPFLHPLTGSARQSGSELLKLLLTFIDSVSQSVSQSEVSTVTFMMNSSTHITNITNIFELLQYQHQHQYQQQQQQSPSTNQHNTEQHLASGIAKVKGGFTDFSIDAIIGQQSEHRHEQDSQHRDCSSSSIRLTQSQGSSRKSRPKNFLCPACEMAFYNNGQLRNHARIHTGERPFRCQYGDCNKTFTRNEELTRHKLIHTGLRPHACQTCGKRFGRKDHLKKHLRTHDDRRNKHLREQTTIIIPTGEQQQQQQQVDHDNHTSKHFSEHLPFDLSFQQNHTIQPPIPPLAPSIEQLAIDYSNTWYNFIYPPKIN